MPFILYMCVCIHIHICSWFVHTQKDKLETFLSWGCYLWLKVTQFCTQRRSRIPFMWVEEFYRCWVNLKEMTENKREMCIFIISPKKRSSRFVKVQTLTERCSNRFIHISITQMFRHCTGIAHVADMSVSWYRRSAGWCASIHQHFKSTRSLIQQSLS